MQLVEKGRESASNFNFTIKSKQNILLFFLTPAEQALALLAQVWVTILWVLQSISISLVFKFVEWKTYETPKESASMETVSKFLLQRFASDKIN